MIITKGINIRKLISWTGFHVIWLTAMMSIIAALYNYEIISVQLPWLPISIIGTAVAFYLGFKNDQAYDRIWEARKIWGGIVNDSRTWGMMVDGYVTNLHATHQTSDDEIEKIKRGLIYRHIAWLYAHRAQLLVPTPWEHISQGGLTRMAAEYYQRRFGLGQIDDELTRTELKLFLQENEYDRLVNSANTATQIVNEQSRELTALRKRGLIDDFRHMSLTNVLRGIYELQGKNERIKTFPLPRQQAIMSRYFVGVFILLLPFSLIPELSNLGDFGFWLSIPISVLIGWIYIVMEIVGDYTENPFQGMANDIPMLSICRTIEIDLREMLGETDLPPKVKPVGGVLM